MQGAILNRICEKLSMKKNPPREKPSWVRIKMNVLLIIGLIAGGVVLFASSSVCRDIGFWTIFVLGPFFWFIRCERCGAPFYIKTDATGELPGTDSFFVGKVCPRCGLKRL